MANKYSKNEILDFLRKVSIMSISAVTKRGPTSSIVLFAVDDNFNFYFATDKSSFKSKALIDDNRISFSVWEHKQMLVQADGIATPIEDIPGIEKVLDMLANSVANISDFWPPILSIKKGEYIAFKIKPSWLRVLDLSNLHIKEKTLPFEELHFQA